MVPFDLIHFTDLFLYSQKTPENPWLSELYWSFSILPEKIRKPLVVWSLQEKEASGMKWIRQVMFFSQEKLVLIHNLSRSSYMFVFERDLVEKRNELYRYKNNLFLPSVISGPVSLSPIFSEESKFFWNCCLAGN